MAGADRQGTFSLSFSSNSAVGLPSGNIPNFFCSARILSRRSKSMMWPRIPHAIVE
jgi:hypothetical protein